MDSFADRVRERMREYGEDAGTARERVSESKSDAVLIREFFEELDARMGGTRGTHTQESKARMAALRPSLVRGAQKDPAGFVRNLKRTLNSIRKEDDDAVQS